MRKTQGDPGPQALCRPRRQLHPVLQGGVLRLRNCECDGRVPPLWGRRVVVAVVAVVAVAVVVVVVVW